ncbi:MAG: galactose-1-phosphate uridylyltransferase [Bacteroidota bacterium]
MPELRKDPIVDEWVIIATERGKRPSDFRIQIQPRTQTSCVFCAGHEQETPPEVHLVPPVNGQSEGAPWAVRVVPNKFPALQASGAVHTQAEGLGRLVSGVGIHEVIIETPAHARDLSELSVPSVAAVLATYRHRLRTLGADPRLAYALIFKNQGRGAGASLEHAHSQLIGLPLTPPLIKKELQAARAHYHAHQRCIYCDYLHQEVPGPRLVAQTDGFVALTPYAARFPFEMWVLPRFHQHDFARITDTQTTELAGLLKDVLQRLCTVLGNPPFNYILHTAPFARPQPGHWTTLEQDYHWHLEITPRLSRTAGFEIGSGLRINPTPPEEAAQALREAA